MPEILQIIEVFLKCFYLGFFWPWGLFLFVENSVAFISTCGDVSRINKFIHLFAQIANKIKSQKFLSKCVGYRRLSDYI